MALALVSCCVVSPVCAQQSSFTNPYGRAVEFTVAMRERQNLIGEVLLNIDEDGHLSVDRGAFVSALANRITPQAAQDLLALEAKDGRVDFQALKTLGYDIRFDDEALELTIAIPLSARPRQDYSVRPSDEEDVGDFDVAAKVSLVANMRLTGDYSRTNFGDSFSSAGTMNIIGRVRRVAFQSGYRIGAGRQGLLREGSRLIFDDQRRALRWQIGDLRPFASSPLGGDDILGFGVSRETQALQPDYLVRVRGTQTFSLEEPSEVTVSVNGRVVTRRLFAPGNYNIADFPFVLGRNQIDLTIQNASGQQQQLSFNQFLDSRLLEAGRNDFGVALGVTSQSGFDRSRLYDFGALTLNAYYIKGVSERLTLGGATNINPTRAMFLATGIYAGNNTITSGRLGLTMSQTGRDAAIIGLGWTRAFGRGNSDQSRRSLRFAFDSRFDLNDSGANTTNVSLGYRWPLNKWLNANADVRLSGQIASASFQTSYSLTRDWRFDVSVDYRFDRTEKRGGPGFAMGLSRSFGAGGQARATYDSRLGETRLSVSRTPELGLGKWAQTVELSTSQLGTAISSAQSALFNRLEVATSASASWRAAQTSQRLGYSVGSAIAFADGHFAVGRPVNDSFAIIGAHKTLGRRTISIDSRGNQANAMARTGRLGPALVSGLGTYAPRVIGVSVQDPPIGYDIGSGTYRVSPTLFGGYHFTVGGDGANTIVGTLLLANGQPAILLAGAATSADWPKLEAITVFTNSSGQFSTTGLKPGRWSVILRGLSGTFDFVVAQDDTNYVDVGMITIRPAS